MSRTEIMVGGVGGQGVVSVRDSSRHGSYTF